MGNYNLRRLQVGAEVTKGTAVTAAKILTGLDGQIADTSDLQLRGLEYYTGQLAGATAGPVFATDVGEVDISGDLTYENAPYIFAAGWNGVAPTTAAGSAQWVFASPTTANAPVKTLTIQTGDNTEQLKAAYGLLPEFEISGKTNELLTVKGKFSVRSVTAATSGFDAATALAATQIPFNTCKFFMDSTGSSFGTTAFTATVREANLKVTSNFHSKQFADGTLYPTGDGQGRPELEWSFVLEYNSTAVGVRSDWKAKTPRLIRMLTSAATSTNPGMYIDVAGYWSGVDTIDESDGNTTVGATFTGYPVSTAASGFATITLNNSATGGL